MDKCREHFPAGSIVETVAPCHPAIAAGQLQTYASVGCPSLKDVKGIKLHLLVGHKTKTKGRFALRRAAGSRLDNLGADVGDSVRQSLCL